jgi:hypothetical protein
MKFFYISKSEAAKQVEHNSLVPEDLCMESLLWSFSSFGGRQR